MKIIAYIGTEQNSRGYIVEMSHFELDAVTADYFSAHSPNYPAGGDIAERHHHATIGREVRVGAIWQQLCALRDRQKTLAGAASALRGLADAITSFDPVVQQAVVPPAKAS